MPPSDRQWTVLARELRQRIARADPGWTDTQPADIGVSLLQVLAYLAEQLAYRADPLSRDARVLAQKLARQAAALAAAPAAGASADSDKPSGALARPRYFSGRLLTADDFNLEQNYVIDRLGRRNRLLYGAGIVDGLDVTADDGSDGPHVVIAPGLAFDRCGREIFVDRCRRLALPASGAALFVQVSYREKTSDQVPGATTADSSDDATRATRIVETFDATLAPAPADGALAIARVRAVRGRWRVDPAFRVQRIRR
jgi:hypothetical protein